MTSPFPLVATRSPVTKTVPLNQLPVGVSGGIAGYDEFISAQEGILANSTTIASDVATSHITTLDNATPGTIWDVYCRGGVQPERAAITSRIDIYLAYCMPGTPVIGGLYGIEGDGHRPVLVPDAMCDVQGWT